MRTPVSLTNNPEQLVASIEEANVLAHSLAETDASGQADTLSELASKTADIPYEQIGRELLTATTVLQKALSKDYSDVIVARAQERHERAENLFSAAAVAWPLPSAYALHPESSAETQPSTTADEDVVAISGIRQETRNRNQTSRERCSEIMRDNVGDVLHPEDIIAFVYSDRPEVDFDRARTMIRLNYDPKAYKDDPKSTLRLLKEEGIAVQRGRRRLFDQNGNQLTKFVRVYRPLYIKDAKGELILTPTHGKRDGHRMRIDWEKITLPEDIVDLSKVNPAERALRDQPMAGAEEGSRQVLASVDKHIKAKLMYQLEKHAGQVIEVDTLIHKVISGSDRKILKEQAIRNGETPAAYCRNKITRHFNAYFGEYPLDQEMTNRGYIIQRGDLDREIIDRRGLTTTVTYRVYRLVKADEFSKAHIIPTPHNGGEVKWLLSEDQADILGLSTEQNAAVA